VRSIERLEGRRVGLRRQIGEGGSEKEFEEVMSGG
jgi:hypothetical protein